MLDLNEVRALILDYFARDFWPVVEHPPGAYSPADRGRAAQIAASTDRVTMDVLPAGHWVHIDPEGLLHTLFAKTGADGGG
jgi:hypothetical protein